MELADKADRSINARIARARFPVPRTLEQFDFGFQPNFSAPRVRELASLAFLDQAVDVLFVGGPGVGETHLGIALDVHACTARRSVLFTHAPTCCTGWWPAKHRTRLARCSTNSADLTFSVVHDSAVRHEAP